MTPTSPAPAPSPCERPPVGAAHLRPEELDRIQDAAAARSWGGVDRRRAPRRRR